MKYTLLLIFFILPIWQTIAQNYKVRQSIQIKEPVAISTDKNLSLLVADGQGNIYKYDSSGKAQLNFSPPKLADITLLEAWQTMRVFVFYRDLQEFLILDRFLNPVAQYPINQEVIGFAQMASLSADNSIWLWDSRDFSLKKYDPKNDILAVHTSFDLIFKPKNYEINFMREYQNLLIINDKTTGILLFDNLGNYKKTLAYPNLNYIGILGDELYFLQNNQLIFYDLYQLKERKIELPQLAAWRFATLLGNLVVTISEKQIIYWQMD
jgi:hypothetical protein